MDEKIKEVTLSNGKVVKVKPLVMRIVREALQNKDEMDQAFSMVAGCTGLSIAELDEMVFDDFLLLQNSIGISHMTKAK